MSLKNYQIDYSCVHFTGATVVKQVPNPIIAEKHLKEHFKKTHFKHEGCPAHVFDQCAKTCMLKIKIKQI